MIVLKDQFWVQETFFWMEGGGSVYLYILGYIYIYENI